MSKYENTMLSVSARDKFKGHSSARKSTNMTANAKYRTIEGFSDMNFMKSLGSRTSYPFKKEEISVRNSTSKATRRPKKIQSQTSLPRFWKTDSFRKTLHSVANKAKNTTKKGKIAGLKIGDFYLMKNQSVKRKKINDEQRRRKIDMNSIQFKAKDYVNKLSKKFDEEQKNNIIHKLFFRYGSKIHRFHESLEDDQGAKMIQMLLRFEKSDFLNSKINGLISSYKAELGMSFAMVREKFEFLWKDMINLFIQIFKSKIQAKDKEGALHLNEIGNREKDIQMLELRLRASNQIIASQKAENKILKESIKVLKSELLGLNENLDMYRQIMENTHPHNSSDERMGCLKKLESLQSQLVELMEAHEHLEDEKKGQKVAIVKLDMLLKENFEPEIDEKGIQVNEKELQYRFEWAKRESYLNPKFTHLDEKTSCIPLRDQKLNPFEHGSKNFDVNSIVPGNINNPNKQKIIEALDKQSKSEKHKVDQMFKIKEEENLKTESDDAPDENAKTKKKKKKAKQLAKAKEKKNQIRWQLPYGLCRFLVEISKDYKEISIVAWPVFQKMIYELYDSRLMDNWEIAGSLTNSLIPFEEYISIYFIIKFSNRRLAELKTLEFLSSLKYYSSVYPKAYVCALVCNLISTRGKGQFNIYLQNYFLFVYSNMKELSEHFVHGEEVPTFVKYSLIEKFVGDSLPFLSSTKKNKFYWMLRSKCMPVTSKDDDIMIDVDYVCLLILREYLAEENSRRETILRNFRKTYNINKGAISLKDFKKVLSEGISYTNFLNKFRFGEDVSFSRGFLYFTNLIATGNKLHELCISYALDKFGLASPFPIIVDTVGLNQGGEEKSPDFNNLKDVSSFRDPSSLKAGTVSRGGSMKSGVTGMNKTETDDDSKIGLKVNDSKLKSVNEAQEEEQKAQENTENTSEEKLVLKSHISSSLMAQHFSILRELQQYCQILKENLSRDTLNTEELWKNFDHLVELLNAGCDFLYYPINF